eukprot:GHRR01028417.1.p2 GENE.GHRR01028417.1~~GHRR01028417.1.p2  ORF type:complete len:142 (-),score=24.39 GHRR01028417.1:199-624(-)
MQEPLSAATGELCCISQKPVASKVAEPHSQATGACSSATRSTQFPELMMRCTSAFTGRSVQVTASAMHMQQPGNSPWYCGSLLPICSSMDWQRGCTIHVSRASFEMLNPYGCLPSGLQTCQCVFAGCIAAGTAATCQSTSG